MTLVWEAPLLVLGTLGDFLRFLKIWTGIAINSIGVMSGMAVLVPVHVHVVQAM